MPGTPGLKDFLHRLSAWMPRKKSGPPKIPGLEDQLRRAEALNRLRTGMEVEPKDWIYHERFTRWLPPPENIGADGFVIINSLILAKKDAVTVGLALLLNADLWGPWDHLCRELGSFFLSPSPGDGAYFKDFPSTPVSEICGKAEMFLNDNLLPPEGGAAFAPVRSRGELIRLFHQIQQACAGRLRVAAAGVSVWTEEDHQEWLEDLW